MARGFKTGGREAGTPNKLTKELRTTLNELMSEEIKAIPKHLDKLKPKDRLNIIVKLMPYVMPKFESEEMNEPESPRIIYIRGASEQTTDDAK